MSTSVNSPRGAKLAYLLRWAGDADGRWTMPHLRCLNGFVGFNYKDAAPDGAAAAAGGGGMVRFPLTHETAEGMLGNVLAKSLRIKLTGHFKDFSTVLLIVLLAGFPLLARSQSGSGDGFSGRVNAGAANTVTNKVMLDAPALAGTLQVTIFPAAITNLGAQWQVDGGIAQPSGAAVAGLAVGSHTISFSSIAGWVTPPDQVVTITNEVLTTASGIYTASNAPASALTLITNGPGIIRHGVWPTNLIMGRKYTVQADPQPGNSFFNWVGGTGQPYAVLSSSMSYTFVMQPNLVLQANFGTNVFLTAQGAYHGLFGPALGPRQATGAGAFSLNVSETGAFSGSISMNGEVAQISGKFDYGGTATVVSTTSLGGGPVTITLQLNYAGQSVSGTVSGDSFLATMSGYGDVFSKQNKATAYEGQYTLIIPGTNYTAIGPYGISYATVKVDDLGNITMAGSLADGTAISQSSVVSKDGYWPLYISLYGGEGSLWGWNQFTNLGITSAPTLSWIKTTTPGFVNQAATLTGEVYYPDLVFPAELSATLQGGDLPAAITVSSLSQNTNGLVLKIDDKTGLINGHFPNPANPKQPIKVGGVLLQHSKSGGGGYFLNSNQSGIFSIAPEP